MSLVSGYSTSYSSVVNDTGATVAAVASGNPFYSSPSAEYHQNFFTPPNWSTSNNNWTTAQNEFPSAHQLQNSPPVSCYSSSSPSDYYYHHHQQQQQQQQQIHHQNHYETVSEPYEEPRNQQQQQHQPIVPATPAVRVVRVVKRRNTANKKERRRTMSINNAFSELRDCIPNVPADTKLSKIKTLRLATSYISYLMTVLDAGPESAPDIPFRAELGRQSKSDKMAAAAAAAAAAQQQQQQQQQLYNPNCILQKEQQATNNNNKTEETTMMLCPASDKQRTTSKGRTGWPHHVWALELKQ